MACILLYRLEYGGKLTCSFCFDKPLCDVTFGFHGFFCLDRFSNQGIDGAAVIRRSFNGSSFLFPAFFRQGTFFKGYGIRQRKRLFCLSFCLVLCLGSVRRWAVRQAAVRNAKHTKIRHRGSLPLRFLFRLFSCRFLNVCHKILCVHCHDDCLLSSRFPIPRGDFPPLRVVIYSLYKLNISRVYSAC